MNFHYIIDFYVELAHYLPYLMMNFHYIIDKKIKVAKLHFC